MDWVEVIGYSGTALTFAAWGMRGAVALRAFGIASSLAFLSFGLLSETWPVVATELVLLPLNGFRLWQLRAGRGPAEDGDGLAWLAPHGRRRRLRRGEAIVRAGDAAGRLTLVLAPGRGTASLVGDARPFRRAVESRTILAEEDVVIARVDLAALENAGAGDPALGWRLARLAAAAPEAAPARLAA